MNTWNAIAVQQETALAKALFTLQTLRDALSVPILNYLLQHDEATFLDLTIATGFDCVELETQLDLLCQTQVVQWHSTIYENYYQIDYQQLEKTNRIVHQLVKK